MNSDFNIQGILKNALKDAALTLFKSEIPDSLLQFQKTRKEFEGDITLVVFPLTKISKTGPEQTGELIGRFLVENVPDVEKFNVVKGFLNVSMNQDFWRRFFCSMLPE
jgi:arginyl-tRNA synthetase